MKISVDSLKKYYFEKFIALKKMFGQITEEKWNWESSAIDEDNKHVSRISATLKGVNVFNAADWPAIISFLKPRILALDTFWTSVKEGFE